MSGNQFTFCRVQLGTLKNRLERFFYGSLQSNKSRQLKNYSLGVILMEH